MAISEAEWESLTAGDVVRVRCKSGNMYDITLTGARFLEHWRGEAICYSIVNFDSASVAARNAGGAVGAKAGNIPLWRLNVIEILQPKTLDSVLEKLSRGMPVDKDTLDNLLRGL